jgi:hypothetical protein
MNAFIDAMPPFEISDGVFLPRCKKHDMVAAWCAWCRGLADVPLIDFGHSAEPEVSDFFEPVPTPGLKFVTVERAEECARCGYLTTILAYSRDLAASICRACGDAA